MRPIQAPRHARKRRKRRVAWDIFLQGLLFAVAAAVLKHHYGIDLSLMP